MTKGRNAGETMEFGLHERAIVRMPSIAPKHLDIIEIRRIKSTLPGFMYCI